MGRFAAFAQDDTREIPVTRRFPSRIDAWLIGLVFGSLLLGAVGVGVALVLDPGMTTTELAIAIVAVLAVGVGMFWMIRTTHYTVDGDTLRVRGGPWRLNIPIASITSVKPSRSLLSSPAWSLDRLEIRHGSGKSVLISPDDREGFLRALREAGLADNVIHR